MSAPSGHIPRQKHQLNICVLQSHGGCETMWTWTASYQLILPSAAREQGDGLISVDHEQNPRD